jgi:hypothetical protein
MIALVVIFVRLTITSLVLAARLTYLMLRALVLLITAIAASISAATRRRTSARRT